jgi:hypothetical protein
LKESHLLVTHNRGKRESSLPTQKRTQLFSGTHNVTLPVVVRINSPDCSPFEIQS